MYRGAKLAKLFIDGSHLGNVEIRIAPGIDGIRFGQTILLKEVRDVAKINVDSALFSDAKNRCLDGFSITNRYLMYETSLLPSGSLWKLQFFTNHGDLECIAFDGIEFYDQNKKLIDITEQVDKIQVTPKCSSVPGDDRMYHQHDRKYIMRKLESLEQPDNFLSIHNISTNDKSTGSGMFILFDNIIAVSKIRFVILMLHNGLKKQKN